MTSGTGQYAIEDLRPGTYTVTFTLAGFTTVKREGIELTGSLRRDGERRAESGQRRRDDHRLRRSAGRGRDEHAQPAGISGQTVAEIPSSRQYSAFTHLIPAINVQGNDFGGSNPALYSVFQIHGGRRNEGQVLVDGMNGGYQGMGVSGYVPEVANSQEVVFSLSGGLGEATTGGPQMNIVGKQGGNMFAGASSSAARAAGSRATTSRRRCRPRGLRQRARSSSCGTSIRRSAARSSVTSCGSSARSAIRPASRMSPACGPT